MKFVIKIGDLASEQTHINHTQLFLGLIFSIVNTILGSIIHNQVMRFGMCCVHPQIAVGCSIVSTVLVSVHNLEYASGVIAIDTLISDQNVIGRLRSCL